MKTIYVEKPVETIRIYSVDVSDKLYEKLFGDDNTRKFRSMIEFAEEDLDEDWIQLKEQLEDLLYDGEYEGTLSDANEIDDDPYLLYLSNSNIYEYLW